MTISRARQYQKVGIQLEVHVDCRPGGVAVMGGVHLTKVPLHTKEEVAAEGE